MATSNPHLSLAARLGAAWLAPRVALQASQRRASANIDTALFLLWLYAVVALEQAVHAFWTAATGDFMAGFSLVLMSVSHVLAQDLMILLAGALALTLIAGRQRSLGRDFDLACVAFLPWVLAKMIQGSLENLGAPGWLGAGLLVLGGSAALRVWVLAVWFARARGSDEQSAARLPKRALWAGYGACLMALAALAPQVVHILCNLEQVRPLSREEPAPDFALHEVGPGGRLSRDLVKLSDYRGHVVVVDFWATWCAPCRQSMPAIQRVFANYRGKGLRVLSVNIEGPRTASLARRMADSLGIEFPLLMDDGKVSQRYRVTTIPHLVVIRRTGQIYASHRGFAGASRVERKLSQAIEQLLDREP